MIFLSFCVFLVLSNSELQTRRENGFARNQAEVGLQERQRSPSWEIHQRMEKHLRFHRSMREAVRKGPRVHKRRRERRIVPNVDCKSDELH